jgi:hypothetical protein
MWVEDEMSRLEMIARELEALPEQDFDRLLGFARSLKESRVEGSI